MGELLNLFWLKNIEFRRHFILARAQSRAIWIAGLCLCLALVSGAVAQAPDRSTIVGKTLVGYQGWFRCPGDGSPDNSWSHWSKGTPSPSTMAVDVYPDVSDLDPASVCALPDMPTKHGPGAVFSSFPPQTADRHFAWMKQYGIDGALIQRFVAAIPKDYREHDAVLKNVRAFAERHGRVFAVEYDLSGVLKGERLEEVKKDWTYLTHEVQIDQSKSYLRESGKPLVALWGIGFSDPQHLHDPEAMLDLIHWFENEGHATVMAGVPAGWGTLDGDSQSDPRWRDVYAAAQIIQPWTVGRYGTVEAVALWQKTHLVPDLALAKHNGQIYMPVIFPGFSWHNLNPTLAA